jgi:hypothetical protein
MHNGVPSTGVYLDADLEAAMQQLNQEFDRLLANWDEEEEA